MACKTKLKIQNHVTPRNNLSSHTFKRSSVPPTGSTYNTWTTMHSLTQYCCYAIFLDLINAFKKPPMHAEPSTSLPPSRPFPPEQPGILSACLQARWPDSMMPPGGQQQQPRGGLSPLSEQPCLQGQQPRRRRTCRIPQRPQRSPAVRH